MNKQATGGYTQVGVSSGTQTHVDTADQNEDTAQDASMFAIDKILANALHPPGTRPGDPNVDPNPPDRPEEIMEKANASAIDKILANAECPEGRVPRDTQEDGADIIEKIVANALFPAGTRPEAVVKDVVDKILANRLYPLGRPGGAAVRDTRDAIEKILANALHPAPSGPEDPVDKILANALYLPCTRITDMCDAIDRILVNAMHPVLPRPGEVDRRDAIDRILANARQPQPSPPQEARTQPTSSKKADIRDVVDKILANALHARPVEPGEVDPRDAIDKIIANALYPPGTRPEEADAVDDILANASSHEIAPPEVQVPDEIDKILENALYPPGTPLAVEKPKKAADTTPVRRAVPRSRGEAGIRGDIDKILANALQPRPLQPGEVDTRDAIDKILANVVDAPRDAIDKILEHALYPTLPRPREIDTRDAIEKILANALSARPVKPGDVDIRDAVDKILANAWDKEAVDKILKNALYPAPPEEIKVDTTPKRPTEIRDEVDKILANALYPLPSRPEDVKVDVTPAPKPVPTPARIPRVTEVRDEIDKILVNALYPKPGDAEVDVRDAIEKILANALQPRPVERGEVDARDAIDKILANALYPAGTRPGEPDVIDEILANALYPRPLRHGEVDRRDIIDKILDNAYYPDGTPLASKHPKIVKDERTRLLEARREELKRKRQQFFDMGEAREEGERPRRGRAMSLSYDWDNVVAQKETSKRVSKSRDRDSSLYLSHYGYIQMERPAHTFVTKSVYTGKWNAVGMAGIGQYCFPHKVEYDGNMKDGMFHGDGTLTYPMGHRVEGQWSKGKLVSYDFKFPDNLGYEEPWNYCQMPDRRFYTSIQEGLRAAGRSYLTDLQPTRDIPEGCYDTGDGFYNPKTKCVWSAIKPNKILRIPTYDEEQWILENCRKAWDENIGYNMELYEHWVSGRKSDSVLQESTSSMPTESLEGSNSLQGGACDAENINTIVSPTYGVSPATSSCWFETLNYEPMNTT